MVFGFSDTLSGDAAAAVVPVAFVAGAVASAAGGGDAVLFPAVVGEGVEKLSPEAGRVWTGSDAGGVLGKTSAVEAADQNSGKPPLKTNSMRK